MKPTTSGQAMAACQGGVAALISVVNHDGDIQTAADMLIESIEEYGRVYAAAEYERGKAERDPLLLLEATASNPGDMAMKAWPGFRVDVLRGVHGQLAYMITEDGISRPATRAEAERLLKGEGKCHG